MVEVAVVKAKFLRGIFEQNTYVVFNKKEAVIIDAGAEVEDLKEIIGNRKVLGVLITHLHFDHIWNLSKILSEFDCNVFIVRGAEERFSNGALNGSTLFRQVKIFETPIGKISYYDKNLKLESFDFSVYSTPGHSKDSVCLKIGKILFTGDTVFEDSIGRTDLIDSSDEDMSNSLKLIKDIDFENAYPGHYNSCDKNKIIETIDYFI